MSEELWIKNSAVELSISAIVFCTTAGKITYVNKAFLSLWGYDDEAEVTGCNASDLWCTDGFTGAAGRALREKGGWIGEIVAYKKNGAEFSVQISISFLTKTCNHGECYVASFITIAERVAAQHEQATTLRLLSERIKELDCMLAIVACQRQQPASLETLLERIVSLVRLSMQWPDRACVRIAVGNIEVGTDNFVESALLHRLLLKGDPGGYIDVGYPPDDDSRTILDEEKNLFTAIAHEIESMLNHRRMENELRINRERLLLADKLASIGVLSAGILHEIGNPNNFIAMNARLCAKAWKSVSPILESYFLENGTFSVAGIPYDEARHEIPKLIDGILEGSDRIRNIGTHLSSLAKSSPREPFEKIDINRLVEHALIFEKNLVSESARLFSLSLGTSLPLVSGNPVQIEQVIINLVTNACQALNRDDGVVSVSTVAGEGGATAVITVEDNGVGIDEKDIPRLTDPFYSTKPECGGTGLGLSVSHHIVTRHNGTMLITSAPGRGTRVTLTFPGAPS